MIDSQSVRITALAENRGVDGQKKIKGSKRHAVVGTSGILLGVQVTDTKVADNQVVYQLLESVGFWSDIIQRLQADSGYGGDLETWVLNSFNASWKQLFSRKMKASRSYLNGGWQNEPLFDLYGIDD